MLNGFVRLTNIYSNHLQKSAQPPSQRVILSLAELIFNEKKNPNPPDTVVTKTICGMKSVISIFESAVICKQKRKLQPHVTVLLFSPLLVQLLHGSLDLRKNSELFSLFISSLEHLPDNSAL